MTTPEPLTAADFELRWDDTTTYPFFEDDNAVVWGYGHPDRAETAVAVAAYYQHTGGDDVEVEASDVTHQWAVRVEPFDVPTDEAHFVTALPGELGEALPVISDTPGAFPVWRVML